MKLYIVFIENIDTIYSNIFTKKHRFHWVRKEVKMAKLKKIAEIKAYYGCEAKDVVETLENKGFLVVDDDENDTVNKIWHVLKNVENG
nr:MAG TPA: clamp loader A subunit [Caudoviricetes sp.]